MKKGLWFAMQRAEIEDVTPRMKKECVDCETVPKKRRLKITTPGRHGRTVIRCTSCGKSWIAVFEVLARRAKDYLAGRKRVECIRMRASDG